MDSNEFDAIDLFSGAGGLSLGFTQAGINVLQAIEIDSHASLTYSTNFPNVDILTTDIRSLDPILCAKRISLSPGQLFILIGGPPCRGYSEANKRTRNIQNPYNSLYKEFFRFLEFLKPEWLLIENVGGFRTIANGSILEDALLRIRKLGYVVEVCPLNSADFGVPQVRRRMFILGNRSGKRISFPEPTHGNQLESIVSVNEAISDLPSLENGAYLDKLPYPVSHSDCSDYQRLMRGNANRKYVTDNLVTKNGKIVTERYKHISPGENWTAIPDQLLQNYKNTTDMHSSIYLRLMASKPAKVLGNFRKLMLIHPTEDRGLSIREAARLQSFPDKFKFCGSIGFRQQQVADAVPPLIAKAIASHIMNI